MAFILDTHILVWVLGQPSRLPPPIVEIVVADKHDLLVSSASVWELATKHRLGKLPQAAAILHGLPRHLARARIRELPISHEDAVLAGTLEWSHRDPFDRMLAAQTLLGGHVLISKDAVMPTCPGLRVMWDRPPGAAEPE